MLFCSQGRGKLQTKIANKNKLLREKVFSPPIPLLIPFRDLHAWNLKALVISAWVLPLVCASDLGFCFVLHVITILFDNKIFEIWNFKNFRF